MWVGGCGEAGVWVLKQQTQKQKGTCSCLASYYFEECGMVRWHLHICEIYWCLCSPLLLLSMLASQNQERALSPRRQWA